MRLEESIANAAWCESHEQPEQAHAHWRDAARTLNQLAEGLNETDKAALRVHPWARQIRRGVE
jgi:hypothetical protein